MAVQYRFLIFLTCSVWEVLEPLWKQTFCHYRSLSCTSEVAQLHPNCRPVAPKMHVSCTPAVHHLAAPKLHLHCNSWSGPHLLFLAPKLWVMLLKQIRSRVSYGFFLHSRGNNSEIWHSRENKEEIRNIREHRLTTYIYTRFVFVSTGVWKLWII